MRSMVLEPDPYGNFLLTGYDYGTARDWARLGLLHLWDGEWLGERILPEGWVDFVTTPAPASEGRYGAFWWLSTSYPKMPTGLPGRWDNGRRSSPLTTWSSSARATPREVRREGT